MNVLAFNFLHDDPPSVKLFPSANIALNQRNDWFIPVAAEDLAAQTVLAPDDKLLELLNLMTKQSYDALPGDRLNAARLLWEACHETLPLTKGNETMSTATDETKKNAAAASKSKAAAKAPAKKAGAKALAKKAAASGRGRSSGYTGHMLFHALKPDKESGKIINPRREGSFGAKSMDILIKAGKDGVSYEDFIKKGGRSNDLAWDIEHGNVTAKAPK